MAEKIKLLELDIDVNQLVKSAADAKKSVETLKTELKELQKEPAKNAQEIERMNAMLKNANQNYREASNVLAKYTDVQDVNNLTIKEARNQLTAISVLWANEAKLSGESSEAARKLADQKLLLTERLKAEEKATGDTRRNVGNYTDSIIQAAKESGIFGGTFGNVLTTLSGAKDKLIVIKQGFDMSSLSATNFGKALVATGIGVIILLVGALVSGLMKLDPVMDKIEQLTAGFGAAMREVTTMAVRFIENIKSVGDLLSKLGAIIRNPGEAYRELAQNMYDAAKAAAELKEQQQNLEDAMQVQEVLTARVNQQIRQYILQSKNRSLSERERQDLLAKAAKLDEDDYLRKAKLADAELQIAEKAIITTAKLRQQELDNLRKFGTSYAIELMNKGLIDKEELENYKKAELSKIAILDESTTRQEKIQNQNDALAEKAQAKAEAQRKKDEQAAKDAAELADKKAQAIIKGLQLEEQEFELHNRTLLDGDTKLTQGLVEQENEREGVILAKKKIALQKEYDAAVIGAKATIKNAELLKQTLENLEIEKDNKFTELDNQFYDTRKENLKKLAEQAIKNAEDELTVFKLQHESRIKDGQLLTDELIQQEIERLTVIKDAAEEIERQRFLSGQITAEEFRAYQLEAEKGFLDTQQGLYNEKTQQLKDAKAIDAANDLAILELNGASKYDVEIAQLERSYQSEIAAAEKTGADRNKIYQKYELAKAAIAKEVQRAQLGSLADGLGQISELLGKNTAAGKAAGIAQATINTYLGVSQVLAAPPSGPEPLNTITKAIAIATTIGTGIANVANIVKVPTKFESGGKAATAGGNRHSSGGTKYYGDDGNVVELEQGENWYVLNRNASSAIGRLSDINQRYGGVSFHTANNSGFYEEGGLVGDGGLLQRSLTGGDIAGVVLQAVDTAFRNVTIVTKVTDVISETGKYNSLVDGANI